MGAVGLLAGREVRKRWRSAVAIALLIGVIGAIVLSTIAGARRTATSLDRFNEASRTSQLEISVGFPNKKSLAEFARVPGVAAFARMRGYALDLGDLQQLSIAAALDKTMGRVVDRDRVIRGRRPDPSAPLEITISEELARRLHLGLGSTFDTVGYTQEQIEEAFAGGNPGGPGGPHLRLRVVGVVRRPLDLGVRSTTGGVIVLTPAFVRAYQGRIGAWTDVLRVRTDGTRAAVGRINAAARRLWGDAPTFSTDAVGHETEGARSAIQVLATALWIVAGISALAGLVAIAIVVTRDLVGSDLDQETLAAMGLTRNQRIRVHWPRSLVMAVGGAGLAAIGAVLLSRFFPNGVARRADPDVGLHADWTVLGIGVALILLVVLTVAFVGAVRLSRTATLDRPRHARHRASLVVARAADAGLRPAALNGLRMAVQPGRGDHAVPVRSAFLGAVAGVAGITAALVFAGSLSHLIDTPKLYGWTWSVHADGVPTADPCIDARSYGLEKQPGVTAVGVVCPSNNDIQVDGHTVSVWGFRSLHGDIAPEVVAGRAPRGPREIALGSVTLSAVGKQIGDTVTVRGDGKQTLRYRVVGQIVLPTVNDPQPLADGSSVSAEGFAPLYQAGENETHVLVVRTEPGTDVHAIEQALRRRLRSAGPEDELRFGRARVPVEVTRLRQIDQIPAAVGALLAVLALAAVGHGVVTAVRRRRREFALLKVLGFTRGDVRATVAWQASITAAVGLVLGIPLGVVFGRGVWRLVADDLGVVPVISSPFLWMGVSVIVVLLLVNVVALLPARSAARTRPAVALRAP